MDTKQYHDHFHLILHHIDILKNPEQSENSTDVHSVEDTLTPTTV